MAGFRKVFGPHNGPSKHGNPTFMGSINRGRKYSMKEGKQEAGKKQQDLVGMKTNNR